ncbi:hypothetical protein Sa4125_21200 [Aureimonas sp. SA4125]|uniref:DUF1127 domain-containing protein n=1 Tax=Aureimonas sp. SA4125 TaxID=2826993 RepID=UPI001CC5B155|nr:DUF1127 domain-containing protein [Aureimonas sp. SA4125]BDA84578.1 hypothetical protein Sa4125_21200 [Aureimonas sp. SA4125]
MFSQIASRFRAYQANRKVASHLARMDDRELLDIGISRSEIEYLVRSGRHQL